MPIPPADEEYEFERYNAAGRRAVQNLDCPNFEKVGAARDPADRNVRPVCANDW